ncbi:MULTISPECIES: DUF2793 domain-containing protein [unclassified Rhizobium]|nr:MULTISPECIES: DUF2793 domain-containing protein [unclassified Rhizobium]
MSDQTNNLALPYILPSQAQKHVTHNEALQRLDAIVQLSIAGEPSLPPSDASEGQCYLVAEGAGGAWSGKDAPGRRLNLHRAEDGLASLFHDARPTPCPQQ